MMIMKGSVCRALETEKFAGLRGTISSMCGLEIDIDLEDSDH